jgi:RNA polymerase sigma factor (sigma-70 family)
VTTTTSEAASGDLLAHWPAMVRVAVSVLGSRDDAEDCAAEALIQVLGQDRAEVGNYEAYLVTVVKRRAVDLQRAQVRARRRDVRLAASEPASIADLAEEVVARAEACWADQAAQEVLSPRVYQLLRRVADGVPMREVARELGLSTRAAESHLLRARKTMRATLGRVLLPLAGLAVVARRMWMGAASVGTATVAALLLLTVPALQPWAAGSSLDNGHSHDRGTHQRIVSPPLRSGSAAAAMVRSSRGVQRRPVGNSRSASSPRLTPIAVIRGPGRSSAAISAGDSGTHEDGPIEMVFACVTNLDVSWQQIGC